MSNLSASPACGVLGTDYRSGVSILVKSTQQVNGMWAFWDGLTWQLWLAIMVSAVLGA